MRCLFYIISYYCSYSIKYILILAFNDGNNIFNNNCRSSFLNDCFMMLFLFPKKKIKIVKKYCNGQRKMLGVCDSGCFITANHT